MNKSHEIAYDFANKAYKRFKEVIKSIVLFGSTAKDTAREKSDIDIIVIVDDCTVQWDDELTSWYRQEMGNLVASLEYSKKLHVNTVTLSVFYDQMLKGEPVVINVIRYGIPLIDFGGFFSPLKILLARGRIKPTDEAIYTALKRAPVHLSRAKYSMLSSVEAIYWALVDSAHAALMAIGKTPPSPEHIDIMLKEHFVRKNKLKNKYVLFYRQVYRLTHDINNGLVIDVRSKEVQNLRKKADEFVGVMARLVKKSK